jgi:hypothetical protein
MACNFVVRLLADYDCYALWVSSSEGCSNVDPRDFAISAELAAMINKWSEDYDQTLNRDDQRVSGFASLDGERRFAETGRNLAERLKNELGYSWVVRYFDPLLKADVEIN